jgi:hypothetical protein
MQECIKIKGTKMKRKEDIKMNSMRRKETVM